VSGENRRSRCPGQFARDARDVEANGSISQHRDEMQEDTAKAKAGKLGNHDCVAQLVVWRPVWSAQAAQTIERRKAFAIVE